MQAMNVRSKLIYNRRYKQYPTDYKFLMTLSIDEMEDKLLAFVPEGLLEELAIKNEK